MAEMQLGDQSAWLIELVSESNAPGLAYIDVAPFLSPSFDPQEYANAIIDAPSKGIRKDPTSEIDGASSRRSGTESPSSWIPQSGRVEGDLSVALGRLNIAIDEVDRLIRDEVTANASLLLAQTTSLIDLRPTLETLNQALKSLEAHQAQLVVRISEPRETLQLHTRRLAGIRSAQALIKRAQRFARLVRRLQGQMQGFDDRRNDDKGKLEKLGEEDAEYETANTTNGANATASDEFLDHELDQHAGRGLSRAASTLAEISSLLEVDAKSVVTKGFELDADKSGGNSLLRLAFVQQCLPAIEDARERVTDLMENMIVRGLRDLSPTMLSTALQTAFNLGQLTDLVRDLLADLTDVIRDRVHVAFDMLALSQELGTKEPQTQQSTTYRARRGEYSSASHQRWTNAIWARVETLIIGEMGAVCSKVYTLERVLSLKDDTNTGVNYLDKAAETLGARPSSMFWSTLANGIEKETSQAASPFLLQTLEQGYPRVLRTFQEFYGKVAGYTATTYTHTQQSEETLVILRSLARFEHGFLAKLKSRFDALLSASFTVRTPPGAKEASALANLAVGELDNARADPLLMHAVEEVVYDRLTEVETKLAELVARDPSTQTLQSLTPSHLRNASLAVATYHLIGGLRGPLEQGLPDPQNRLGGLCSRLQTFYDTALVEPLLGVICKDISDSMARMHYVDFSLDRDAVSGSGSAYMADLADRLWFLREQLFVHYEVPTATWLLRISRHALRAFVMNASLIRPLAEGGKLKLTSDMTELEFSISQLLASAQHVGKPLTMNDCGPDFTSLRNFRHLLFSDPGNWQAAEALQAGLSPVAAAHHLIARSHTVALPSELRSWTRIEYLRWLEAHSQQAAMDLLGESLNSWQEGKAREGSNPEQRASDETLVTVLKRILALHQSASET